jgi:hypothetical protein
MSAAHNAVLAAAGLVKKALEAVVDTGPAPAAAQTVRSNRSVPTFLRSPARSLAS